MSVYRVSLLSGRDIVVNAETVVDIEVAERAVVRFYAAGDPVAEFPYASIYGWVRNDPVLP